MRADECSGISILPLDILHRAISAPLKRKSLSRQYLNHSLSRRQPASLAVSARLSFRSDPLSAMLPERCRGCLVLRLARSFLPKVWSLAVFRYGLAAQSAVK